MRKLLLVCFCVTGISLMSCQQDDDTGKWEAICDSEFVRNFQPDKITNLTDEQKSKMSAAYSEACIEYYADFSICRSELYDRQKCEYIDNTAETMKAEEEAISTCRKDYPNATPEQKACLANVYRPCQEKKERLGQCADEEYVASHYDDPKIATDVWEIGDDFYLKAGKEANAVKKALGMRLEDLYYEDEGYKYRPNY